MGSQAPEQSLGQKMEILMGGRVGQAECHKCYIKFPKNEMKKIEVKGSRSGSSMSANLTDLTKGLSGIRMNEGRQYYGQAWICKDCQGGGKGAAIGCAWFIFALFALLLFLDTGDTDTASTSTEATIRTPSSE